MNELQKILLKYPNKPWHWECLSKNPNITIDFINQHSEFPWDKNSFNENPNQSLSKLKEYINAESQNIEFLDLEKEIQEAPEDFFEDINVWCAISWSSNLNINLINKYPNKPWEWECVSENIGIKLDDINKYPNIPWRWKYISANPNITLDFIQQHIDKNWNWTAISENDFMFEFAKHKYIVDKIKFNTNQLPLISDIKNIVLKYLLFDSSFH